MSGSSSLVAGDVGTGHWKAELGLLCEGGDKERRTWLLFAMGAKLHKQCGWVSIIHGKQIK